MDSFGRVVGVLGDYGGAKPKRKGSEHPQQVTPVAHRYVSQYPYPGGFAHDARRDQKKVGCSIL